MPVIRRRTRFLLWSLGILAALTVSAFLVIQLPSTQGKIFRMLRNTVQESTGLLLDSTGFSYRLLPAKLRASGVRLSDEEGRSVLIKSLEIDWKWRELLYSPPRLGRISARGIEADPSALPQPRPQKTAGNAPDPWEVLEFDSLDISGVNLAGQLAPLSFRLEDAAIRGLLISGRLVFEGEVSHLLLEKEDRHLDLGRLQAKLDGNKPHLSLRRLGNQAEPLQIEASAEITSLPAFHLEGEIRSSLEPDFLLDWWDPELAEELQASGHASFSGTFSLSPDGAPQFEVHQEGPAFSIAGLPISAGRIAMNPEGLIKAEASDPGWGKIRAALPPRGRLQISGNLEEMPAGRLLAERELLSDWLEKPFRDLSIRGRFEFETPLPPTPETLQADADLELRSSGGTAAIDAAISKGRLSIRKCEAVIPGASISLQGTASERLELEGKLDITEPAGMRHSLEFLLPPSTPEFGGGPIAAEFHIDGTRDRPELRLNAAWESPLLAGESLDVLNFSAYGPAEALSWQLDAERTGAALVGKGQASLFEKRISGQYSLDQFDLAWIPARLRAGVPVSGRLDGAGRFDYATKDWTVEASLKGQDVGISGIDVSEAQTELHADGERLRIDSLHLALAGGAIEAAGDFSLEDSSLGGTLSWQELKPRILDERFPLEGSSSGSIRISGNLNAPEGKAQLMWRSPGMLSEVQLSAQLAQGRIRVQSEKMASAGGPLYLRANLPLGDLPRPTFLLPGAPGGPWTVNLIASAFRIAPLLVMTGREEIPIDGSADLDVALQWLPSLGGLPQLQAAIDKLVLQTPVETFHTEAPIHLGFDGEELVLGKTTIRGLHGDFDLEGSIDLKKRHFLASAKGSLAPSLAELAPITLHMDSPMKIEATLDGPLDQPAGHLKLEEGPGLIVVRNPPLQIEQLRLEASFADGVLDIDDGHARINGGEADLGGGWDPTYGQGLVTEFENLSFLLPNDILSRWDGAISIEPSSEGLATVVGDLKLLQGLWERPFDLSAAMRNEGGDQSEESEMAHLVRLDLEVYGRSGIHVNNNLGQFDLQWNALNITGTAAEPRIVGDVHFLPGGTLNLPGKQVPIRRGLAQFTGDPLVDPLLEIVPNNSSVDVLGSPSSISSDEAAGLAKAGLSTGLSAFLGLSNTTIRPEDIAADTETDTSTEFSIGQQLGQSTALFLTTDLRDSQRRTTLFQVWQLPYLPDLTIQAQTRTDTGESDLKLLKRFRWGGTTSSSSRLEKIHFKGKWPISKIKLRSLSGLSPGQSWDPFLLFMARVRLEEALAKRGYPEARVDTESNDDPEHPEVRLRCEAGRKVEIRFSGDKIPRKLRARARALYRFPPLESSSLKEMQELILRHLWAEGFADAGVEIDREDGEINFSIIRGERILFERAEIEGLPESLRDNLLHMISTPAESAAIRKEPRRIDAHVRRALAYGGYRNPGRARVDIEKISRGVERLRISIDPGPQAHLEEVLLEGKDPLGILKEADFPIKKGIPLDRRLIDGAISRLRKSYRSKGYTQVHARAFLEEISEASWRLRLRLESGAPEKVVAVNFKGLKSIRERYLRKTLGLEKGSLFLLSDLDDSLGRISRFSPVRRVDAEVHHTPAGAVIDLSIEEAERWTVEVGGGWNSDRGPALRLGLRDDNLLGRGLKAALRTRLEKNFKQGRLILTLPPLPGGHFALGLNTSYTEDYMAGENEADLTLRENKGQATLDATWQLEHGLFLRGYYRFTRTHLFEEDPIDPWFPVNFSLNLAALGSQIIIDRLDDPFDPHSGAYLGLDLSWAGSEIGSDTENIRGLLSASMAVTSTSGWTWFQSLRLGAAHPLSGSLDPNSRFYAGGPSTIRGFRRDSVGPSELLGDQTIYVGGGAMMILNEEIRFPLWRSLRGALFVDTGQVWEQWSEMNTDLSAGAGLGLRWTTPIGPLWLDAAWPVIRAGTNSGARFSFGIGRTF